MVLKTLEVLVPLSVTKKMEERKFIISTYGTHRKLPRLLSITLALLANSEEMNPCANGNGGCSHICTSKSDGSHECSCEPGYALGPDGNSCVDIDECVFEETCARVANSECANSPGSFSCVCREGFSMVDGNKECAREYISAMIIIGKGLIRMYGIYMKGHFCNHTI